ncbi:hypothetical protein E2C01_061540 [Portunus trituberculatus]|uniref:Uncharacterized protein n=1 Tax=Portunus trituberculatus TaxID=210409 RepID=A0A5B7HCN3_PORTR|nr:hypothetical protein [Portunus trituberculatus]
MTGSERERERERERRVGYRVGARVTASPRSLRSGSSRASLSPARLRRGSFTASRAVRDEARRGEARQQRVPRKPSAGRGREARAVITALCARQDKAVCCGAVVLWCCCGLKRAALCLD